MSASTLHIAEAIPYSLSSTTTQARYSPTGVKYDIAINSEPYFLAISDDKPYIRQTAPYRKEQVDLSSEPGEQSLVGWWVRAQSSFHRGSGIKFYDPSAGEEVEYRITDSKGVDLWTKGEVTLLNTVTAGHATSGVLAANGRPIQVSRPIIWGTTKGVLVLDYYHIEKVASDGTVTSFKATTGQPIYALCDDGNNAFWLTNVASKFTMIKKPLSGSAASTADEVTMATSPSLSASNAVMEYVKERIIVCIDNSIYEMNANSTSFPTPLYTHPDPNYVYTGITASGPAIYVSGFNGAQSSIQKFTLSSVGVMPTLTSAITSAEMPVGELIFAIYYYLGVLLIGTSKGIRAAGVSDQDGSLTYGPLIVETSQPCYGFAGRDHFVWCATGVDGAPGVIRIDLAEQISIYQYAYANDAYDDTGTTGHRTTSVAFFGNTSPTDAPQLSFTTIANGTSGYHYTQSATVKMSSGYITTGAIRYSTLEKKLFKYVTARVDNTYGSLAIASIDSASNEYTIANFTEGSFTPSASVTYPVGPQENLSFKFTLTRYASDSTLGPTLRGYQVKALVANGKQRLIQYPLASYNSMSDKMGNKVSRTDYSYTQQAVLEALEEANDTVRIEDFRTGESYLGTIEDVRFVNVTPTDKRFSGYGGVLTVTIRKTT